MARQQEAVMAAVMTAVKKSIAGAAASGRLSEAPALSPTIEPNHKELENLNDLRNELLIERLDLVSSLEDAKKANISNKEHIHRPELTWNYSIYINSRENILEYLKPHHRLKEIGVVGCEGTLLPTWMGDSSLNNLVTVRISKTYSCLNLPPLGQLTNLKHLFLEEMHGLKHLDCSFCGRNEIHFPKLEKLHLEKMSGLQEWLGDHHCALPSLRELTIKHRPALLQLIHEVPSPTKIWRSLVAISLLPSLTLSGLTRAGLPFEIGVIGLTKLEDQVIENCKQLKHLPFGLRNMNSLAHLEILDCPGLSCNGFLSNLQFLSINNCPELIQKLQDQDFDKISKYG
ncbi:hypothetical protein ZIOFF_022240 [Zingiber officinale]|uniref:R13L1/DRL21-like LRR repeat region domain-containing protein n=1 Tax=Zingiber officinale TaxID=94328 RepID=A0A8J5H898_ZINOF|nr:hypothetical protein ZIOFF_022240 [Zingiber officinale]